MNNKHIEWRKQKLEGFRDKLEAGQLNALRELLPNSVIKEICEESQYEYRNRLLTPIVTIFHMIGAGISREGSFQSAWQMGAQSGQSGSLAKARKRIPLEVWTSLHEWISTEVQKESTPTECWRGHRLIGVDGTCLSMSEESDLVEYFGRQSGRHGKSRYPLSRVLLAFNLKSMMLIHPQMGSYEQGETSLLKESFEKFSAGDVLVMDRHYSGANLYAEYEQEGIHFIARSHHQRKVENLKVVREFSKDDRVVEIPVGVNYRRLDQCLPEAVEVRMVKLTCKIRGEKNTFWIATSLKDAKNYPAKEIREVYKRRWKVEGLIEELKVWLGADVLRSKSVEGIYKELYARVIGMNLIHWLILRASRQYQQPLERISTSATLRLTLAYSLKMSTAPAWQLSQLYEDLLQRIASSYVPYRENRLEPRMIRRETKFYPMLKMTRREWKALYAQAA